MCEQLRGTLHVTEPGILGLHSRMSSSRMPQADSRIYPRALFLVGTGNHVEAVTALLSAASLPRAARNLQIVFSYTHPLLSHPGRVKIRVMLCALQFKASCIHHVRVCSTPEGSTLPGQTGNGHGKVWTPQLCSQQSAASRPLPVRTERKKILASSSLMLRQKNDKLNSQRSASVSKASCGLDRQG